MEQGKGIFSLKIKRKSSVSRTLRFQGIYIKKEIALPLIYFPGFFELLTLHFCVSLCGSVSFLQIPLIQ